MARLTCFHWCKKWLGAVYVKNNYRNQWWLKSLTCACVNRLQSATLFVIYMNKNSKYLFGLDSNQCTGRGNLQCAKQKPGLMKLEYTLLTYALLGPSAVSSKLSCSIWTNRLPPYDKKQNASRAYSSWGHLEYSVTWQALILPCFAW